MLAEYTTEFLIEIAENAKIPRTFDTLFPWQSYSSTDGWLVVVFFDAGDLDYIDHFIAPDGTKINVWGADEPPEDPALRDWPSKTTEE